MKLHYRQTNVPFKLTFDIHPQHSSYIESRLTSIQRPTRGSIGNGKIYSTTETEIKASARARALAFVRKLRPPCEKNFAYFEK